MSFRKRVFSGLTHFLNPFRDIYNMSPDQGGAPGPVNKDFMLLEDGFNMLLEDGDKMLLESSTGV